MLGLLPRANTLAYFILLLLTKKKVLYHLPQFADKAVQPDEVGPVSML